MSYITINGSLESFKSDHIFGDDMSSLEDTSETPKKKDYRVDTSKFGGFNILKKDNIYMLSLTSGIFYRDNYFIFKSALALWLMERTKDEIIIVDSFDGVLQGYDDARSFVMAASRLGIFMNLKARLIVRLNHVVGNIISLIALMADEVHVGSRGSIYFLPFIRFNSNDEFITAKPFINYLYKRGQERGLLTEDEYNNLVDRKDDVWIKRDTLIERGAKEAVSLLISK